MQTSYLMDFNDRNTSKDEEDSYFSTTKFFDTDHIALSQRDKTTTQIFSSFICENATSS